jgi:hypothetical protein
LFADKDIWGKTAYKKKQKQMAYNFITFGYFLLGIALHRFESGRFMKKFGFEFYAANTLAPCQGRGRLTTPSQSSESPIAAHFLTPASCWVLPGASPVDNW